MKYSVRYNLRKKCEKEAADGRRYIFVRVSWDSKRIDALTGLQVLPEYWEQSEQRVRPAYRHSRDTGASLNKRISEISASIDQHFVRFQADGHVPTTAEVKQVLASIFGTSAHRSDGSAFFDIFDTFVTTMTEQNGWAKRTQMKFRTLENRLRDFAPKLEFSDLNDDGLQRFLRYLIKRDLKNYTIEKDFSSLRWFLRWATKKGYNDCHDFEDFRPHLKGVSTTSTEIIYLEWDELMTLFDFDFGENHQGIAAVRDVFCFCCFTGLRYSDVAKLRKSDIKDGYISVVTQKTSDSLRIELNDFSKAILARHTQEGAGNALALPVISCQKMNDYLKDIGKMLEFDTTIHLVFYKGGARHEEERPKYELLSSHCARRTFVVNALRLGIPAEVIMKWTGHKDYKAMKPYIRIVDELKEREMSKFNQLADSPKIHRK